MITGMSCSQMKRASMRPVIDHQDVVGAAEQQVQDRRQTTAVTVGPVDFPFEHLPLLGVAEEQR
jgi:hypothetical protein|tara:strand:- start:140 stop:331 length:192 start_codon:yes stop_codon:yes gene_type:complete